MADYHSEAVKRYEDAVGYWNEQYQRIAEDFRFSNPADPQQWDADARNLRRGRPCMVFDRTNQFIAQVVNDARQNKAAIKTLPVDSKADVRTAKAIDGLIRHIEYTSRADQAYDTALEHAARGGIGWLRVVPEIMRPETNEQELRILRVHDPLACYLDPTSVAPDGSDAMYGFVTTRMSRETFARRWPKADASSWESPHSHLWGNREEVTVCEYQSILETKTNRIVIADPIDGIPRALGEDEYWQASQQAGGNLPVLDTFTAVARSVKWCTLTAHEIVEETVFPARWIGLVPVYGDEAWIEGRRWLCGMVRKLRPAQQAYNYERSAAIEYVALQPKAPILTSARAIEGYEAQWRTLNQGNPAYLPFNDIDEQGPVIAPQRLAPPALPASFVQLGQVASTDMEAAVGMHRANLGQQGSETSGRAIQARQHEGDTANFHYADNLTRSIAHLGRIVVDMLPRIYDQRRIARIIGEDGQHGFVTIEPGRGSPRTEGKQTLAIDLTAGAYDVRVTAGAAYMTQRQEAAQGIETILQAVPALSPALVPALMKLRDWPDAEKYSRMVLALSPPQVQAIANEDDEQQPRIPPALQAQMQQMQQHAQALQEALQAAGQDVEQLRSENEALKADKSIDAFRAETERMKAMHETQPEAARSEPIQPTPAPAPAAPTTIVTIPGIETVEAMAVTMTQAHERLQAATEAIAVASAESTQALQEALAGLTAAAQSMAVAAATAAAPRAITIQRGPDGRPNGAVAAPLMQ